MTNQTPIPIASARRLAASPYRFGPPVKVQEVCPGWAILVPAD